MNYERYKYIIYLIYNILTIKESFDKYIIISSCGYLISILSFLSYVDEHAKKFVKTLSDVVSIKSVSADPSLRNEVVKMMQWAELKLQALGATTELCDIGTQVHYLI